MPIYHKGSETLNKMKRPTTTTSAICLAAMFITMVVAGCWRIGTRNAFLDKGSTIGLSEKSDTSLDVQTWDCGIDGGNVTATLKDNGLLVVRGAGAMWEGYGPVRGFSHKYSSPPWDDVGHLITDVVIEEGVTSIGKFAFAFCSNMKSVVISSSVITIGPMAFYFCDSLTSVTIKDGVRSIGTNAFHSCTSLTSVKIPSSVMLIEFEGNMFLSGDNLTSITVSPDNANYSSEDGILFNKNKTSLIRCPMGRRGVYTIPSSVTTIGCGAFVHCANLVSVTIPNSVTTIEMDAFASCTRLKSLTIPSSVKSIGARSFLYCQNIMSVRIPNSVTSIGEYAFRGCYGLTSVTISGSVTSIGECAFGGCTSLTSINMLNPIPLSINIVDEKTFVDVHPDACLNVPANSLAAYHAAEGWRDFKCIKPLAPTPNATSGR